MIDSYLTIAIFQTEPGDEVTRTYSMIAHATAPGDSVAQIRMRHEPGLLGPLSKALDCACAWIGGGVSARMISAAVDGPEPLSDGRWLVCDFTPDRYSAAPLIGDFLADELSDDERAQLADDGR